MAGLYHDLDGGFTPLNFLFPSLPLPSYRRRDIAHQKMRKLFMSIIQNRRDTQDMVSSRPPLCAAHPPLTCTGPGQQGHAADADGVFLQGRAQVD